MLLARVAGARTGVFAWGGAGGGALSSEFVVDGGSASSARRKPVFMKSKCVCVALRFVSKSACSSESCSEADASVYHPP